jgi:hypothetical protein
MGRAARPRLPSRLTPTVVMPTMLALPASSAPWARTNISGRPDSLTGQADRSMPSRHRTSGYKRRPQQNSPHLTERIFDLRSANGNRVRRTLTLRDGTGTADRLAAASGRSCADSSLPSWPPSPGNTPRPGGACSRRSRDGCLWAGPAARPSDISLPGQPKRARAPAQAPVPATRVPRHAGPPVPTPAALQPSIRGQRTPRRPGQRRDEPARRPGHAPVHKSVYRTHAKRPGRSSPGL